MLGGDAGQLFEVLYPPLCLDGVLGLQLGPVPGALHDGLHQLAGGHAQGERQSPVVTARARTVPG